MAKLLSVLFALIFSGNAYSQLMWFRDYSSAQSYALEENKLILIDFWAIWCGPCKSMDSHLWNTEEFTQISKNLVLLKVDIDQDIVMKSRYNVKSIPQVLVVTVTGEVLLEKTGFSNATSYLNMLSELPGEVSELNSTLIPELEQRANEESYYKIALAFQELGRKNEYYLVQDAFLDKSNYYFNKVKGKESDPVLNEMSELHKLLNIAYRGKTKQVHKKLSKMDPSYSDPQLVELLNFIQAYCYKVDGDEDNFLIKKKLIENEDYLTQLES